MSIKLGSDNPKKLIVATYLETGSIKETATKLNYSFSWVYKVLHKLGLVTLSSKTSKQLYKELNNRQVKKIIADYLNQKPTSLILKSYNISSSTLYFILNQHKIPGRNSQRSFNWSKLSKQDKAYLSAGIICATEEGKVPYQISQELGVPVSRIKLVLQTLIKDRAKYGQIKK